MNLKRITAFTLTALISVNGSITSVLANGPDDNITPTVKTPGSTIKSAEEAPKFSPLFKSRIITPTIETQEHSTSSYEEDTPTKISPFLLIDPNHEPTSEEIESLFKKFLDDDKILQTKDYYAAKLILDNILESFAEKQCIDELPSKYKSVIDNYCKTDFYTVENEEDNLEHKLKSISEQIYKIDESVKQLLIDFSTCKENLDKKNYEEARSNEAAALNFADNFYQMKNIRNSLLKNKEEIIKLEKNNYEIFGRDSINKYKIMYSNHSHKKDGMHRNIAKIINTQLEKYNLQINYLSRYMTQTKKAIDNANKRISKLNSDTNSFLTSNSIILSLYRLKNENDFLKCHITSMQEIQKDLRQTTLKEAQQDISTPTVNTAEQGDYCENNISPISKPLHNSFTTGKNQTDLNVDINLIDKEIKTIFSDEAFAKYVYTYILCNDESSFDPSYKLSYLDAYTIQKTSQIFFTTFEQDINNLEGIQYFVNLKYLCCPNKNITNIDLTKNKKLEYLDISGNNLESGNLNLSENTNIKNLNCKNCNIKSIELPNSDSMVNMDLSNNNLHGNLDLASFNNLLEVNLANNNLTELIVSHINVIANLNIANNKGLGELDLNNFKNLVELDCSNTDRKELKISELKKLERLSFQENIGIEVDISDCKNLKYLTCYSCDLNELDLSQLTALESFDCSVNNIKTLLIPSTNLKQAIYFSNPLEEIKISKCVIDTNLYFDGRFTGPNMYDDSAEMLPIEE